MSEGDSPPLAGNGSGSGPVARVATVPLQGEAGSDAVPALGSVIADKYRVDELIARGGMGAVYMATHLVSGKRVALKWMLPALGQLPGAKERFVREACATARIDHPNVIDIYDVGNEHGCVYLVMELLRGETLADYLARFPIIEPTEAIQLLMPALRGVAAAHSHQVIHRDLKPDNIFLCRDPDGEPREPRVLDFGISKIGSPEEARDMSLTCSGAVMGTPYYMSPEQVRGARDVDARGDVYAFGVILYEMITGQRPFEADTYNQLILKIATEDPPPIATLNPNIDEALVSVIERAMARDPAARFPSIDAFASALEPFAGGLQFRVTGTRILTPAANSGAHTLRQSGLRRPLRRRSRQFIALGILVGMLLTAVVLWGAGPFSERIVKKPESIVMPVPAQEAPRANTPETAVSASSHADDVPGAMKAPEPVFAPPPDRAEPEPASANSNRSARSRKTKTEPAGVSTARHAAPPEPEHADSPAPARLQGGKLPDDWDDRLSIPARAPAVAPSPAGRIDADDLR